MSKKHGELVLRAVHWLEGSQKCCPVVSEPACWTISEQPDAWGVNASGSILVECKVSVADFYKDGQKLFRRNPHRGMGRLRYFLTWRDVLHVDLIQRRHPGWGLIEVRPKTIKRILKPVPFVPSAYCEGQLIRSALQNGRLDRFMPSALKARDEAAQ